MSSINFKPIRIGNIEYRYDPECMFKFEHTIIQWFKNSYYGKFDDYMNDGYAERDGFLVKDNIRLDRNLFYKPEMNIIIGYLQMNAMQNEYDIVSLGRRLIDLSNDDLKDFKRVLDIFDEEINGKDNL